MSFQHMRSFITDLQIEWEEFWWKLSNERRELASLRLAAHNLALKEGRVSPYVDPESYTENWVPVVKLR